MNLARDGGTNSKTFCSSIKPSLSDKTTQKGIEILEYKTYIADKLNDYFVDIVKTATGICRKPCHLTCSTDETTIAE